MNKRVKIVGVVILVLVIASQWFMVRLAYAGKLSPTFSHLMIKVYNLKAATITDEEKNYDISLSDYLSHKAFIIDSLSNPEIAQTFGDININEVAWQRTVKDVWLRNFGAEHNLEVGEVDVNEYMGSLIKDESSFDEFTQENYHLSWLKFKTMFVEPLILEDKVYTYLLDNYNDLEGIRAAQSAYEALEAGRDFTEVAKEFATDTSNIDNSVWLQPEDLVDFYEPIADLQAGEFSKIVPLVGGYVIWYVESVMEADGQPVWEVKSIFIKAKTIESFFQDYLNRVTIKRKV